MSRPLASEFAAYANNERWIGIPYSTWDCQAFVEEMLRGVGAYKNYKGSNDIWRNGCYDRNIVAGNAIPAGCYVFTVRHDGGEKERGYFDSMGNALHIGIYIGDGKVIHSSTGGVQWDVVDQASSDSRWTHYARSTLLDYQNDASANVSRETPAWREKAHALLDNYLDILEGKK